MSSHADPSGLLTGIPCDPLMRALCAARQQATLELLRPAPAGAVLQVCGPWPELELPEDALRLGPQVTGTGAVRAAPQAMPLRSAGLGAVVLVHTLDGLAAPDAVLAEAERVLLPGGQLLVVGLNPWSLCGLRERARVLRQHAAGLRPLHSPGRLRSRLLRLGLPVEAVRTLFFRPPFAHRWMLEHAHLMERIGPRLLPRSGGIYVLAARKQRAGVRPLLARPVARAQPVARPVGYAVRAPAP